MEEGFVLCPRCKGRCYIQIGWKFMEGTSTDIRVPTDEKEECEGCKHSKYPGYVYMPPTITPDGKPHYNQYYKDQQPYVSKGG